MRGVELGESVARGPPDQFGRGDAGRGRFGLAGHGWISEATGSERLPGQHLHLFGDRAEGESGEELEAADDEDDAGQEADEEQAMGGEGAGRGGEARLAGERSRDRHHRHDIGEPAEHHRDAERRVPPRAVRREATKGGAIVSGRRRIGIEDLGEAVRTGIAETRERCRQDGGDGREAEDRRGQDQDGEHGHLHFLGLDLLAEIFGRATDHQASDEDRDDRHHQEAVEAGADAAGQDLAELDHEHRHEAADRRERAMHGIDAAIGEAGGHGGEQRRAGEAEADLLALHIAAGRIDACGMQHRRTGGLGPIGDADADDQDQAD